MLLSFSSVTGTTLGSVHPKTLSFPSRNPCTPLPPPWSSDANSHLLRYLSSLRLHFLKKLLEAFHVVSLRERSHWTQRWWATFLLSGWDPEEDNKTTHLTTCSRLVFPATLQSAGRTCTGSAVRPRIRRHLLCAPAASRAYSVCASVSPIRLELLEDGNYEFYP